ncbi:MAG: hypothetical protein JO090_06915 [Rhizobacter sp.]|nr:hypothetical protein [Rhizobacter sp.]
MNNDTKTYGTTTTGADANRDPLTGAPGAHPVGTAAGAVAGGAAGAAVGSAAGPVGTVVGAAVGAVVGGLAGKGIAEQIDPTVEDAYWRDHFSSRPYASGSTYDEYRPAYRHGWDSYSKYPGRRFDEVESDLSRDWDRTKGESRLTWDRAKLATKDAWNRVSDRVERAGDSDYDRR